MDNIMGIDSIVALKELDIDPSAHTVKEPSLALHQDIKAGIKTGTCRIIGIVIVVSIIICIAGLINNKVVNYFAAGTILVGALGIWASIKATFVSGFKPNLRTPEGALRSYLFAIDNGLYERAYNMLTDQAKVAGDVPLPKEVSMEKAISRIVDLETFRKYWQNTGLKISDINREIMFWGQKCDEANTALFVASIPSGVTSESFNSKYVLVKRDGLWFVAHGYLII
jgi:hypothetical protein